jgi:hypothetical protein
MHSGILLLRPLGFGSLTAPAAQPPSSAIAQEPATILEIQIQNAVLYSDDATGPSQLASSPAIVPATASIFRRWIYIGDIVSVNGTPAKGGSTVELSGGVS